MPPHNISTNRKLVFISLVCLALGSASMVAAEEISGIVRKLGSGDPIAGALVTLRTTAMRTTTGIDGSYTLDIGSWSNLVVVAASKGYFNQSVWVTPPVGGVDFLLEVVPLDDDPDYTLWTPIDCAMCHLRFWDQWVEMPMADAGLNTWVHDIYSGTGTEGGMGGFVYLRDSVHAASNPASECASCHQPQLWIESPFSPLMGPEDVGYPSAAVAHGISCDVCHKLADVDVEKINFPGIFPGAVTFNRPAGPDFHQVQYGVLGDVDYQVPIFMRASYQPQLVAEVCGTCHQDKNDPDGNHTFNGVTSEPTYQEWVDSPYGDSESPLYATCVDCHMPPSGENLVCDVLYPPLVRDPQTIRSHDIKGTTPQYLENAVEMTMETQRLGDTIGVVVSIDNSLTGHHVPTGVTVRNMILLVQAWRDGEDPLLNPLSHTGANIIHDLGGIGDPAQGYYAGLPGRFFSKVNHDASGAGPTFFTEATGILFDNRIPALGSDTTDYTFTVAGGDGNINVRARLIYRRAFRFLVDAKSWTKDGQGNPLQDVLPPHFGHLMEIAEQSLAYCEEAGDGDVNGDGLVDGRDIGLFVDVLFNASTGPAGRAFCAANIDADLDVDSDDLDLFIGALVGG